MTSERMLELSKLEPQSQEIGAIKLELNFKLGHHTINGHMYPEGLLEEQFNQLVGKRELKVTFTCDGNPDVPRDLFGVVEGISYELGGRVIFLIETPHVPFDPDPTKFYKNFKEFKGTDELQVSIKGVGTPPEEGKDVIEDFQLVHLFLVRNESA